MLTIHIKKLSANAIVPTKAHATDAAFDIYSAESYTLHPGERHIFSTGIASEFPPEYFALWRDRSSLGSKGIQVLAGVLDAAYRGEWKVVLFNASQEPYPVAAGDRIAQCMFLPVPTAEMVEVHNLSDSDRGSGGFGSSGK